MRSAKQLQMQGRFVQTMNEAKAVLRKLKPRLNREGMGCIVFVMNTGESGAMSYLSTVGRKDGVTSLIEWLGHVEPELLKQAVERWQRQKVLGPERIH